MLRSTVVHVECDQMAAFHEQLADRRLGDRDTMPRGLGALLLGGEKTGTERQEVDVARIGSGDEHRLPNALIAMPYDGDRPVAGFEAVADRAVPRDPRRTASGRPGRSGSTSIAPVARARHRWSGSPAADCQGRLNRRRTARSRRILWMECCLAARSERGCMRRQAGDFCMPGPTVGPDLQGREPDHPRGLLIP